MNIKVLVIDKVTETFDTKKGSKTLHMLVCQDQSRPPLRNSFDYEMTAEEFAKHGASDARGQDRRVEHPRHEPEFLWPHSDVGCNRQSWRVMETALTYTLQRVHWQFFGTLTFKSAKLPERVRVAMFFALVRCLAAGTKSPFASASGLCARKAAKSPDAFTFTF
jgi:hypothetical protein